MKQKKGVWRRFPFSWFWDAPLLAKLLLSFCAVSVIPLLLLNLFYYFSVYQIVLGQETRSTRQLLHQRELGLQNALSSIDALSLSILFDPQINELITTPPQEDMTLEERLETRTFLTERLKYARAIHDWIVAITIVSDTYEVSSSAETVDYAALRQTDWYREFVASGKQKMYTPVYVNEHIGRWDIPMVALLWRINDQETGQARGTLVIEMRYSQLEKLFVQEGDSDNITMVVDEQGRMIYPADTERLNQCCAIPFPDAAETETSMQPMEYQGREYYASTYELEEPHWSIVELRSGRALLQQARQTWSRSAFFCGGLALVVVVLAVVLALYISRPIRALMQAMKQVEQGDFSVRLAVHSRDEVGRLTQSFNSMARHLQELMNEVYKKEKEKREQELKALQAQINPHFLYNTLGTVRWMAIMQKANNISEALQALIRLLEFSTKRTAEFVSVEEELEHVAYYAQLLKFRYGGKFELEMDVDPTARQCRTIRFLLQPLVENAVFHGIEAKDGTGRVTVRIRRYGGRVFFSVQDNGVGMDFETVAHRAFTGVGIQNVNQRLIQYFGPESALQIKSRLGVGTTVYFLIPFEEQEEHADVSDLDRG